MISYVIPIAWYKKGSRVLHILKTLNGGQRQPGINGFSLIAIRSLPEGPRTHKRERASHFCTVSHDTGRWASVPQPKHLRRQRGFLKLTVNRS